MNEPSWVDMFESKFFGDDLTIFFYIYSIKLPKITQESQLIYS